VLEKLLVTKVTKHLCFSGSIHPIKLAHVGSY